jgi:hypothetical protein
MAAGELWREAVEARRHGRITDAQLHALGVGIEPARYWRNTGTWHDVHADPLGVRGDLLAALRATS